MRRCRRYNNTSSVGLSRHCRKSSKCKKNLARSFPTEAFSRAVVQKINDHVQLCLRQRAKIIALWEEKGQQAVRVFVRTALPWLVRLGVAVFGFTGRETLWFIPLSRTGHPQYLHRTIGKQKFCGFVGRCDTGLTQKTYRCSLNAPLKKEKR